MEGGEKVSATVPAFRDRTLYLRQRLRAFPERLSDTVI